MPVYGVKARIKFDPDVKPSLSQHTCECKQLDIVVAGNGDIDGMIDDLTDRIRDKITEEFRTQPQRVILAGYTINLNFTVEGPVNRSLAEFSGDYKATIILSDGTEIPVDKLTKTANQVIEYAKRTGKSIDQVLAEAKAELAKQRGEGKKVLS